MPDAQSLKDLLQIRAANKDLIDNVNNNLGSAVGFRYEGSQITDEPAVLIFVQKKINNRWLPTDQRIPEKLIGPGGLTCRTDVIEKQVSSIHESTKFAQYMTPEDHGWDKGILLSPIYLSSIIGEPPLSEENLQILEILHGSTDKIFAGSIMAHDNMGITGTLGCYVTDKITGNPGILTNQHVAGIIGENLKFPWFNGDDLGKTLRTFIDVTDQDRFPGIIDQKNEHYRVDCAYVELNASLRNNIDPSLLGIGKIGNPKPLDIDTMEPVGQRVISVGARRGVQTGMIAAFSYEYSDYNQSIYTDYLIIGDEDVDEHGRQITKTAFSNPGDSGKVIVADNDDHNVIALLWGGWQERLRPGRMQEDWTYAIDINYVLDLLQVDILS